MRKILAIKLRSLGDTVLMTAPLAELRRAFPGAEIHVAVVAQWAPLLEKNPAVDRIWSIERHSERPARAKAIARLAIHLRKEKFDAVVNFHASPSSALAAFATGAKVRAIHFHGHRQTDRYSTVEIPGKGTLKPIIERDMDAVRALGVEVPEGRMPEVFLQKHEQDAAEASLAKLGLTGPILGLGLGASRPTKSWPIDRFAALAVSWCESRGGSVLAVAGPGEEWLVQGFLKSVDDVIAGSAGSSAADAAMRAQLRSRIAGEFRCGIRELAAVQNRMAVFAGNDSGPKHVAVAVGTPTVTIFGPEHPFEWHPYPVNTHPYFFVENLLCRRDADPGMPPWCGLNTCLEEKHKCMTQIGIDAVLAQCNRVARLTAPKAVVAR